MLFGKGDIPDTRGAIGRWRSILDSSQHTKGLRYFTTTGHPDSTVGAFADMYFNEY